MINILLSLIIICFLTVIVLLKLLKQKRAELNDIARLYSNLSGVTGFDNIIEILTDEINNRGLKVIGFFRKNRFNKTLESDNEAIPLLEKSSAVRAFFTLMPCKLGNRCKVDTGLVEKFGADTVFIPIHMKKENPCRTINNCRNKDCAAYSKNCICWLHSGKTYRDITLKTHNEKTAKCLNCASFLSIGIFAVQGNRIGRVHTFINNHFSGILKNSVLYERAVYSANMDSLTNIFNRRGMQEHLTKSYKLAEKYNHPISVSMFDIDHFKKFNDTYGHQAGDLILHELAQLVSSLMREVDILARYGGEEFCIIFPHTDKAHALEVTERIREEVERHVFSANRNITISMGTASYPDDDIAGDKDLIKKADIALYRSKITRNTVTAYSQGFEDNTPGHESYRFT